MVNKLTNRVHGVRSQLKDAVKNQSSALKEAISPVPAVVLYDIVGLGLNPKIERYERDSSQPSVESNYEELMEQRI